MKRTTKLSQAFPVLKKSDAHKLSTSLHKPSTLQSSLFLAELETNNQPYPKSTLSYPPEQLQ